MFKQNNILKTYLNLICQSNKWDEAKNISAVPRPRLKTPPNDYGNRGQNAKYYDKYVQDEAHYIYMDKYGEERGTKLWQQVIYIGNAMFQACDQILGQRRTMYDIIADFFYKHQDLKKQCTDFPGDRSWIINWVFWILIRMIQGDKFTDNYISECIPLFKVVRNNYPITMKVLLQQAGLDLDTYKLSKKIQARVDAEQAAELKAQQEKEEKQRKEQQDRKNTQDLKAQIINALQKCGYHPNDSAEWRLQIDMFIRRIKEKDVDVSVGLQNLIKLPEPINKDEQRIYDIILKSNHAHKASMINLDLLKALNLAYNMNNKIGGEEKRAARRQAAQKYGLIFIANCFK